MFIGWTFMGTAGYGQNSNLVISLVFENHENSSSCAGVQAFMLRFTVFADELPWPLLLVMTTALEAFKMVTFAQAQRKTSRRRPR